MVKMETDTLSNYEQALDKHVLDDSMDINIPRNDERTDTHEGKETVNSEFQIRLKDSIGDNTESRKVNCESSENKENENDCDRQNTDNEESHSENEINNDKDSETDGEKDDNVTETIESEEINPSDDRLNDDKSINNAKDDDSHCEEEKESLNGEEKDPLNIEEETVNKEKQTSDAEQDETEKDIDNAESSIESSQNTVTEKEDKEGNAPSTEVNDKNEKDTTQIKDKENETNSDKAEDQNDSSKDDKSEDSPLLKETLTKTRSNSDDCEQKETEGLEDMDMDDDFDPSLLCPDIAMEVDEAPVITSNDIPPSDGDKSPLLYEPIFSTYVDEMTGAEVSFNLSMEEHKLRQERFGEDNPVQYSKIHCTACNVHLGSALDGQSNRFVHPLLKVLICKDCYHFYTSGEFEKDEDGSELYCRWCGQGGQVICCSSCEMVFCKKCIRINFGRKKLTEIRDSDDWLCFRCDPAQLTSLRVHCAEFMEYVRREISRAATLENATSFMTTDYTQCCLSQKKKYVDPHPGEPKKKKRKSSMNDPDYDPMRDRSNSPQASTSTVAVDATAPKLVPILPKPMESNQNATPARPNAPTMFRVGNTTFRPRSSQFSQPRPRVQVITPTSTPSVRPQTSGPGYIKIMPGGIRVTPSPRNQTAQTFTTTSPRQSTFQHRPMRPGGNSNSQMKHEWFEKTVRAAARVNSNLSYTLTQLNRAQANATSVEALAVVHNKLQEILSTSINSLIQIRKNLRTEFIAGIKNIRFPPKPQPQPSTSSLDDDVIIVSHTPSPGPPPLLSTSSSTSTSQLTSLNLPPSVSLTKRTSSPSTSGSRPSTSNGNDKPKVFLRVKSLTALQSVPSECITIPDDPLPPPPPLTPIQKSQEVTIIDNSPEKDGDQNDGLGSIEIRDVHTTSEEPSEGTEKSHSKDTEPIVDVVKEADDNKESDSKKEGDGSEGADGKEADGNKEVDGKKEAAGNVEADGKKETVCDVKTEGDSAEADGDKEERSDKESCSTEVNGDKGGSIGKEEDKNSDLVETENEKEKMEENEPGEEKGSSSEEPGGSALLFDVNEAPSSELKKMFNVKIQLKRSEEIDSMVKQVFGLVNGDTSE